MNKVLPLPLQFTIVSSPSLSSTCAQAELSVILPVSPVLTLNRPNETERKTKNGVLLGVVKICFFFICLLYHSQYNEQHGMTRNGHEELYPSRSYHYMLAATQKSQRTDVRNIKFASCRFFWLGNIVILVWIICMSTRCGQVFHIVQLSLWKYLEG